MNFQYKGLKAVKSVKPVTDAQVMKELENIRRQRTQTIPVTDRSAQLGDEVIIDYAGFVGDWQFPGGTAEKQPLTLGSGMFIPGFEEQLVGVGIGDKVDVNVTFPEVYHSADLAGKEAVFQCTVHGINEKKIPELNDDFAKMFAGVASLEDLKAQVKAQIQEYAEEFAQNKVRDALLKALVSQCTELVLDEEAVKAEIQLSADIFSQQIQQQGMTLEAYLKSCNHTEAEMHEQLRPQAEDTVRARMALEEICRLENITVTDAEIDEAYENVAQMYGMTAQQLRASYPGEEALRKDILMKKAIAVMEENAEISAE